MSTPSDDSITPVASKSQRKRDSEKLQLLGRQLIDMPDKQLQTFNLEEPLLQAIYEARRLNSREAKRRQIQYIGKLMRAAEKYMPLDSYIKQMKPTEPIDDTKS